jgi:hypothetical protein
MGYGVFVLLGTGEVGVLLSVGIFLKLLVHSFVNGVIVVNAKFVHVCFPFHLLRICDIFRDFSEVFIFCLFLILSLYSLCFHMSVLCLIYVGSILCLVCYFV